MASKPPCLLGIRAATWFWSCKKKTNGWPCWTHLLITMVQWKPVTPNTSWVVFFENVIDQSRLTWWPACSQLYFTCWFNGLQDIQAHGEPAGSLSNLFCARATCFRSIASFSTLALALWRERGTHIDKKWSKKCAAAVRFMKCQFCRKKAHLVSFQTNHHHLRNSSKWQRPEDRAIQSHLCDWRSQTFCMALPSPDMAISPVAQRGSRSGFQPWLQALYWKHAVLAKNRTKLGTTKRILDSLEHVTRSHSCVNSQWTAHDHSLIRVRLSWKGECCCLQSHSDHT